MNLDNKWLEELYRYAERNIVGYKRPADYKERAAKVLNKRPNPMRSPK